MKKYLISTLLLIAIALPTVAQKKDKYQGLLWEISGNSLKKPSYLYGTMHVSNKVAFHLSDSFFIALNNVDMAALEIDPRIWLDYIYENEPSVLSDHWNYRDKDNEGGIGHTKHLAEKRKRALKVALASDLEVLNYLMFRNDEYSDNFEEDTYLDLYIFQTARKLNKRFKGLESFEELDQINEDLANEDQTEDYIPGSSRYSNDDDNPLSFGERVEDAYRRGDLDLLDSLNVVGASKAFVEHILFRRNINMANRMDSIMKEQSLFTGVGAAHLPGDKGIIELLRKMGYTLRPVTIGERDAEQKKRLDTLRFGVSFTPYTSFDGFCKVETPGKLFEFPGNETSKQYLCADMINGAYYRVMRVKTFAELLNHDNQYLYKTIDSLLYENIPGEILSQKKITKFGFDGFDITNRTRKGGHLQRYQIFVTPAEIFIFKLAGNGEYVNGPEAERFFNSIWVDVPAKTNWQNFYAPDSLFSIRMPHAPLFYNDTSVFSKWLPGHEYSAIDFENRNQYFLIKQNITQGKYLEEDSVRVERTAFEFLDNNNLEEINRKFYYNNTRPVLDILFLTPDSNRLKVRFTIKLNTHYTVACKYSKDSAAADSYINSFVMMQKDYPNAEVYVDSALLFTVKTGYTPKKTGNFQGRYTTKKVKEHKGESRAASFFPPNSYNGVYVDYYRYGKYYNLPDSGRYWKNSGNNSDFITTYRKFEHKNGYTSVETKYADTGSSIAKWSKVIIKNSVKYTLTCQYDTADGPGEFIKTFFATFEPLPDTAIGTNLFTSRANVYINDLNGDSAHRAQALESMGQMDLLPEDITAWRTLIDTCDSRKKNYIDYKVKIINKIREIKLPENVEYLTSLYYKAGDTSALQMAALYSMAAIKTDKSYKKIRELILEETPLVSEYNTADIFRYFDDSLQLSKSFYPDFFQLMPYTEYKKELVLLLAKLVDSSQIKPKVYKSMYPQLLTEAKIALKRQTREDLSNGENSTFYSNQYLENLSSTLMPFYKDKKIKGFYEKLMGLNNLNIKLTIITQLLKNDIKVADSLFTPFAKHTLYRAKLYKTLVALEQSERFPKNFATQELMVQSLFKAEESYADTFVMLDKRLVEFKGQKGWVYFFKYKSERGDNWYTGVCGLQPEDTTKVNTNILINNSFNNKFTENISVEKQFTILLKKTMLMRKGNSYDY